ncbi:MAG: class I SAM-dependent methyltransferase [Bacteroidales bacterium]|nr:class I SAM-dependent methyltransferase [Bacteroidales bacterium]
MREESKNRYVDRKLYFDELCETAEQFYIEYLKKFKEVNQNTRILEIGCGEGGNLLPFARMGCKVAGFDLSRRKIENARAFFEAEGTAADFFCADVLSDNPFEGAEKFDILLIHDVFEHIEQPFKHLFFERINAFLKNDGIVFFGFPAWQMPFGGHQQACKSKAARLPFIHLLPAALYRRYLLAFKEDPAAVEDLMSIKRSSVTVEHFERLCKDCNYRILERQLWLISPHYRAKFGFTPRKLSRCIAAIPYLRNFFSTSCFYVVKPE